MAGYANYQWCWWEETDDKVVPFTHSLMKIGVDSGSIWPYPLYVTNVQICPILFSKYKYFKNLE